MVSGIYEDVCILLCGTFFCCCCCCCCFFVVDWRSGVVEPNTNFCCVVGGSGNCFLTWVVLVLVLARKGGVKFPSVEGGVNA